MSLLSLVRSRAALPALVDVVVFASLAGFAFYQYKKAVKAEHRERKAAAAEAIQTWEGEGGNIVPPQPSDAAIADPPKVAAPVTAWPAPPLPSAASAR